MADDGLLDLTRISRKVWLVKVPKSVAQAWRPLCEQAMNPANLDEEAPPIQLGTVRIDQGQVRGQVDLTLTTTATAAPGMGMGRAPAGPSTFKMATMEGMKGGLVAAVAYKPGADKEGPTQVRVEGQVDMTFSATPVTQADNKGDVVIDASYRAAVGERNRIANTKTRTVQTYKDNRRENLRRIAEKRTVDLAFKAKGEEMRRNREDNKRVRADPTVLEAELFRLFQRQAQWTFGALQMETRQPAPHLKSVLEGIAILTKRGAIGRDMWELKKEFQTGTAAGAGEGQ